MDYDSGMDDLDSYATKRFMSILTRIKHFWLPSDMANQYYCFYDFYLL